MCGLTGFVASDASGGALESVIRNMTDVIAHRGPDDEGFWTDEACGVALGHRRLSILDLSPEGHQPMISESGRYIFVYNGEVYNYGELLKDLVPAGHKFRGHSDTEVMLAAFEEWGIEQATRRFNGFYAFGVWDRKERKLHLVRDRLGIKPMYYGWRGGRFFFGSELKSLRVAAESPELDRNALAMFLRYSCIPAPYSIYQGIFKLPQGTILSLSLDELKRKPAGFSPAQDAPDGASGPRSYWSAAQAAERGMRDPFTGSFEDAQAELHTLLLDAIKIRMVADVPLGAFLSGGIDSSLVVALMQAQSAKPVRTFSIGFQEDEYNEAAYAKAVAAHLHTDHTELYVTPREAMEVIPQLTAIFDEPFSDTSQIPTLLLARMARKHVTVSLSGDGGDELFGGYSRYLAADRIERTVAGVPAFLRGMVASGITGCSRESWDKIFNVLNPLLPEKRRLALPGEKMHKLAKVLRSNGSGDVYRQMLSHWDAPSRLIAGAEEYPSVISSLNGVPHFNHPIHRMMYLDLMCYLPDEVMVKVDRTTMAASLEAREPLLDYRLAEFSWRLPLSYKIANGKGKWILRKILDGYVPAALVERPKMGFGVPLGAWLRGPLREWASDLLSAPALERDGVFNPAPITTMWREHLEGRYNFQYYLWDVLMAQSWLAANR